MKTMTKTQTSDEGEDKEVFLSDLHYEIVMKQNVKEKIKVGVLELNEKIAALQKKKEEEAEAQAQEQTEAQDNVQPQDAEKKTDPLEYIKTEQDKREWVLKELQIIETTDVQRKKYDRLRN
jgi:hypothetical protein